MSVKNSKPLENFILAVMLKKPSSSNAGEYVMRFPAPTLLLKGSMFTHIHNQYTPSKL